MAAGTATCFLILLLFAAWISFANASQDGIPDSNHKTVPTRKGLLDGDEHAVTTAATANKNWLGGRKSLVLSKQMKKKRNPKDVKMSGAFSSTNTKCGNGLGCQQITVSHFSDEVVDDHDQSGFVAFNADYHAPRHHPPKNN